jgi:urease accessory protein UreF
MSKRTHDVGIERAIVLQLLRDDHAKRWSRAELETELHHVEALVIDNALERLKAGEVVHLSGEQVCASRCAWYLDRLELIAV